MYVVPFIQNHSILLWKGSHEWYLFFLILQTDDKGVFCTDLSQEYQLAASTFGLSPEAVWQLSQQAIDCVFAADAVKQQLKQKWAGMKPQVFKWPVQLEPTASHTVHLRFFLKTLTFYEPIWS